MKQKLLDFIQTRKLHIFGLMFGILLLLSMNYTILRSVRNTLAVVGLGKSSYTIPFFELFGVLPAAFIMTWLLSKCMHRFSIHRVFLATMLIFLGFFACFAFVLYPLLMQWKTHAIHFHPHLVTSLLYFFSMIFYVIAELWQPALMNILFWGLINQKIQMKKAKKMYPLLIFGSSIGAIIAGPLIVWCNTKIFCFSLFHPFNEWHKSFIIMTLIMIVIGVLSISLYNLLWKQFALLENKISPEKEDKASFKDSLKTCINTKALRLLSWIVIAEYVAYALGEVIFLDVLRKKFPDPRDYCSFMGKLSFFNSSLTIIMIVLIAPLILKRFRWEISAMMLPLSLLIIEIAFFFTLRFQTLSTYLFHWDLQTWLNALVILGSIQYCVCRSMKHSFSDASKELAFVSLPHSLKMRGKLVVDGICARLGRGGASVLSLSFINLCGGVIASSSITGVFAIAIAVTVVITTRKLGALMDRCSKHYPLDISKELR